MSWILPVYVWAVQFLKIRHVDRRSYTQMLPCVLFNQCVILLPSMVIVQTTGLCFAGPVRLSPLHFLLSLPAMAIGHDIVQYLAHLLALGHSLHHTTNASRGVAACYMSAPDFFLEIVLPYLVPLALIGGGGSDILFHTLIVTMGAFGWVYEHSGYDLMVLLPPECNLAVRWPGIAQIIRNVVDNRSHREHHMQGNVSFADGFGSPGICDTFFRTRWDLIARDRQVVVK
ncbi:hypothetical protein F5884DRAFT_819432 [Xylogone sp. PMI_703]|nr:hypothetical protein F5884DRAFT_819432 [Xylogone sp. PMI_703]